MSGDTQTEWRRGGDPANPPIDRVGRWQCRWVENTRIAPYRYVIRSLDPYACVFAFDEDGEETPCGGMLWEWQKTMEREWRYIGPLPADGTEQPEPAKGDREAFEKAYHDWRSANGKRHIALDTLPLFLLSPAGRAAVLKLWGESSLASQFEEAQKECEDAHDALDKANAAISRQNPLADRIIQLAGARDEWKSIANSRRINLYSAQNLAASLGAERDALKQRVTEVEKVIQEASDICSDTGWRWNHEEDRNDSWLRWLVSRLSPETETIQLSPDAHIAIARMERRLLDLNARVKELESRQ